MAVTHLTITSRQPFAQGQAFGPVGSYEQLDGTVYFAVDPSHPANGLITDLELAPRDTSGRVPFAADFRVLQPVERQRGNQRILFDVLNRGKALALRNLNSAPDVVPHDPLHPGNGFLMRHGYTVAWCGWQHDVPDVAGLMRLQAPQAVTPEGPISGQIAVTFLTNQPTHVQMLANGGHRAYPVANLDDRTAILTVQDDEDGPEHIIPRDQWAFARVNDGQAIPDASHIYMAAGFQPGKIYQAIYTTTGAPVAGLGLLATRDMAAFLKYGTETDGNPCAGDVEYLYGFGVSQSGRFLRSLLHLGLTQDEADRQVFDGVMPHVAGGKRGEFNHRFAQPSSQASRSPNNQFPFSDLAQTDLETGDTDGILSRLDAQSKNPKVMYTYTSSEYWAGHGALVHIDINGTQDVEVPESVRIYHFAGTQHGLGPSELCDVDAAGYHGQYPFNWTDYRPLMRAALVNLDRWVTAGELPPPSAYPRIDNHTAVLPESVADTLQSIPGVKLPEPLRRLYRLDFGSDAGVATQVPPKVGAPYPCRVPMVDADGNETSGLQTPFHRVPLATYMGWNVRHADIGGEGQVLATGGGSGGTLLGAMVPFAPTLEARQLIGDARLSIAERYASKADYLEQVNQATQTLIRDKQVLADDLERILEQAAHHYDLLSR